MKKTNKLFMVLALVGALSFSSCVKDTESASVADLRKAKAEELTSIAKLNAIKAENEKIMATAEAAMKNAQAEAAKANAEMIKIEAQIKATQSETAKLELEAKKAELEVIKQKIANELKTTQGQLEIDLARQQAEIIQAQEDLKAAQSTVGTAEKVRLQNLLKEYNQAFSDLEKFQRQLFDHKKSLIEKENNLITLKEAKAKETESLKSSIVANELRIAMFKKYAAYQGSPAELDKKTDEAERTFGPIKDKNDANYKASQEASNTYNKFLNSSQNQLAITNTAYAKAYIYLNKFFQMTSSSAVFPTSNLLQQVDPQNKIEKKYSYTVDGITREETIARDYIEYKKVQHNTAQVNSLISEYNLQIKEFNTNIEKAEKDLKDLQKVAADKKKAWDDAMAVVPVDQPSVTAAKGAYFAAESNVTVKKLEIQSYNSGIENTKKTIAELNIILNSEAYATYSKTVDDYNNKSKELIEKLVDALINENSYRNNTFIPAKAENDAIASLIKGGSNLAWTIKALEDEINTDKQQLSKISTAEEEEFINSLKANIARDEEVLATAKKVYDAAKAALDAAIK